MIGDVIRRQRMILGISQLDLAKKINSSQSTVAGWESGRYKPTYDVLPRLAAALCCTLGDLCEVGHIDNSAGLDLSTEKMLNDYAALSLDDRSAVAAMVSALKMARQSAISRIG